MNGKCWANRYCKKKSEDNCSEECDIYVLLKALYSQSNIPKVYQIDVEMQTTSQEETNIYRKLNKYLEEIWKNVINGKGLYLHSVGTGNGKTTWACKMVNAYFRKIVFTSSLEYEGFYINTPTFLEELRASYDEKSAEFSKKMYMVMNCKLLVIDDIGSEKPSDWVTERLYTIINNRITNGLATIYTSNVSLESLETALGHRIASRIKGSSDCIKFIGIDRRYI